MKILCLGCSYTNGRVKNQKIIEHTWPYILCKETGHTVYNFAESGSNNIFNTRILEENIVSLNPDVVIYQIVQPNRFYFYPDTTTHDIWKYVESMENFHYLRKDLDGDFFFFGPSYHKYAYPSSYISNPEKTKNIFYKYFQDDMIQYIEKINMEHTLKILSNTKTILINWYKNQTFNCDICVEENIGFADENICDSSNHFSLSGNQKLAKLLKEEL